MKFTKSVLTTILDLMESIGYKVRFEKGNFQSGYCIVKSQKIAIVNKFFDTKARINCLLDILSQINFEHESLTVDQLNLLQNAGIQLKEPQKMVA